MSLHDKDNDDGDGDGDGDDDHDDDDKHVLWCWCCCCACFEPHCLTCCCRWVRIFHESSCPAWRVWNVRRFFNLYVNAHAQSPIYQAPSSPLLSHLLSSPSPCWRILVTRKAKVEIFCIFRFQRRDAGNLWPTIVLTRSFPWSDYQLLQQDPSRAVNGVGRGKGERSQRGWQRTCSRFEIRFS